MPGALLEMGCDFSGLALFAGCRSGLASCCCGLVRSWLARGSLAVIGIFRIVWRIAARSTDCTVRGTNRVFLTVNLEQFSIFSFREKKCTYCWNRRDLGTGTGVQSGLMVSDDAYWWVIDGGRLVHCRVENFCLR